MHFTTHSSPRPALCPKDTSPVNTADQGMSSAEGQTGEPGDREETEPGSNQEAWTAETQRQCDRHSDSCPDSVCVCV